MAKGRYEKVTEDDLRLMETAKFPKRTLRVCRDRLEGRTYDAIATDLGVTRERVRQIEIKAVAMAREA